MQNTILLGIHDCVDGAALMATTDAFAATGFNTGNLAFVYALNRLLGGRQEIHTWDKPAETLDKLANIGIVPCANQLGPHQDYKGLGEHFGKLSMKLVTVGLGAQSSLSYADIPEVPEGTRNWVRAIAARSPGGAPNIGVRGAFSHKVLAHYGLADNAVILGCPTLFINADAELGEKIEAKAAKPWTRIAVAGGHQGWTHLTRIEVSLARMMERSGGSYIVQSPIEPVHLARGETEAMSRKVLIACRDYACPDIGLREFRDWARRHYRAFFNISEWMECLRGHDFVVGARIHGVMLGLQAGVPSMCIVHDSRTRELCETLLVPHVSISDIINGTTLEDLRARYEFNGAAFDANRVALAKRFNEFLVANRIEESAHLRQIAGGLKLAA